MSHTEPHSPAGIDLASPRAASSPAVAITPFGDARASRDDVVAMLVAGSHDPEVRAKNYLPACMDAARARAYLAASDGVVLWLGDRPVGVAAALHAPSPGEGVAIPAGSVELDMWVLPPYRGQGMRWFPLVAAWLAQRFDHVVGVTWADNHTAIALLKWSGWQRLGRTRWTDGTSAGDCEVFVYDLAAFRARRT